jgi:hypothetical protein
MSVKYLAKAGTLRKEDVARFISAKELRDKLQGLFSSNEALWEKIDEAVEEYSELDLILVADIHWALCQIASEYLEGAIVPNIVPKIFEAAEAIRNEELVKIY